MMIKKKYLFYSGHSCWQKFTFKINFVFFLIITLVVWGERTASRSPPRDMEPLQQVPETLVSLFCKENLQQARSLENQGNTPVLGGVRPEVWASSV